MIYVIKTNGANIHIINIKLKLCIFMIKQKFSTFLSLRHFNCRIKNDYIRNILHLKSLFLILNLILKQEAVQIYNFNLLILIMYWSYPIILHNVTDVRDYKLITIYFKISSPFAQKLISLKAALCILEMEFNPSTWTWSFPKQYMDFKWIIAVTNFPTL